MEQKEEIENLEIVINVDNQVTFQGEDSSDDDQRIVRKINHQLQAHTIVSAKVLNDFIQKATKAGVNRKIYQSRLKQVQNASQPQPPPPQVTKPKQVRIA